jgi:hypothetical protein
MNYWSRSMRAPRRADEMSWRRGPLLVDRLAALVVEAQEAGELVREEPADVAERLLALIDGLSLHALLDPRRVTRERQVSLANQELDRLTVAQSRGGET